MTSPRNTYIFTSTFNNVRVFCLFYHRPSATGFVFVYNR